MTKSDPSSFPAIRPEGIDRIEKLRGAAKAWADRQHRNKDKPGSIWQRLTFTLPREQARATAREILRKYPKEAYWTEVESWRVLEGDRIEFTMRRLPSAD
jgi:hypothetical protein